MSFDSEQGDRELVEGARQGDEGAFDALYRRHRRYVLAVAARFGVTGDDALDVLQEAFFYFFRKLPGFELQAKFTTFLYPVAKNLSLRKKAGARRLVLMQESGVDPSSIPSREETGDPGRRFAEAVGTLPEEQREVALLRFVDGMSLREIALALEVPVGTVKSRLHNGLARLRREEEAP